MGHMSAESKAKISEKAQCICHLCIRIPHFEDIFNATIGAHAFREKASE